MKWYRVFAVLAFFFVVACTDPILPRYPEEEDNKKDDETPQTGFVVEVSEARLV